jgi:hypothetical protein
MPDNSFSETDELDALIEEHPGICAKKYRFKAFKNKTYPFSMLCALGASRTALKKCCKAFPFALTRTDEGVGTTLHYACAYQPRLETIKFLVKKNPDAVQKLNEDGRTPLHMACACASGAPKEVIEFLLQLNPQAHKKRDKDDMTPLQLMRANSKSDWGALAILKKFSDARSSTIIRNEDYIVPYRRASEE